MAAAAPALAPYDALAAVYDQWTAENDYARWADYLADRVRGAGPAGRVLDLCCGTGTMTRLLQQRDFDVDGVDASAEMLRRARDRVAPITRLLQLRLPSQLPLPPASYDAAICCFDSVNYFSPEALAPLFSSTARVLRAGGQFLFDVNTRHKLETVFGDTHYGDDRDQDGFAYVWRNRYHGTDHRCDFEITLFTAERGAYRRQTEHHSQWWFSREEISAAARAAGFNVAAVTDDYRNRPPGPGTLRETWTLTRRDDARSD